MSMKKIFILLSFILLLYPLKCQTTLLPGDIAFLGVNTDGNIDDFDFVLLTPVTAGTIVNFTDCGWNHGTGFNTSYPESHIAWTTSNVLTPGTVITVNTNNGNSIPTASIGTISGDKMLISIAGDQISAYQGTMANPTFIAAIDFNQNSATQPGTDFDGGSTTNSTTALPDGLTIGLNALHIYQNSTFAEQDNSRYKGTLATGSKAELLKAINSRLNWDTNDVTPFTLNPFSTAFTVDAAKLVVTPTESITYAKDGGSTMLNITSNSTWTISSNQSWLSVTTTSGVENSAVRITSEENSGGNRNALVTITASGLSPVLISITQTGVITGVSETNSPTKALYPNPATNGFTIDAGEKTQMVLIYNLSGSLVLTQQISGETFININALKQGMYIVKANGSVGKLIKK